MRQYLTFMVANETYGIDVLQVQEVLEHIQITRVPKTPRVLLGVFNLRGAVIPALDLGYKLGTQEPRQSNGTVVTELLVGNEKVVAGLLVDEVNQVVSVEDADILPPPRIGTVAEAQFVDGVVRRGDGEDFIILLDTAGLIQEEEINNPEQGTSHL